MAFFLLTKRAHNPISVNTWVECVEDDEARLEEGLVRIQAALAARQLDRWQPQTFFVVLYVLDSLVQFVKHIH